MFLQRPSILCYRPVHTPASMHEHVHAHVHARTPAMEAHASTRWPASVLGTLTARAHGGSCAAVFPIHDLFLPCARVAVASPSARRRSRLLRVPHTPEGGSIVHFYRLVVCLHVVQHFAANFFFSSLLLDLLTADELEKGEREKESDSRCTTDVHGIVPVDRGCGLGLGRIADSVSSEVYVPTIIMASGWKCDVDVLWLVLGV